ncbi:MAG: ABC transporter ATP-binding protein [Kiritimatiellia bacterium]
MNQPLLSINRLSTHFPVKKGMFSRTTDHIRAVDDVSFALRRGEALGLVGESGCGKSTLARTILMIEKATAGTIRFKDQDLLQASSRNIRQLRRHMQVVFQDPFAALNPGMTVAELITEGLIVHGLIKRSMHTEAAGELLREVGLGPEMANRFPHEFSGGQRQRICIARAIALRPELLICDEAVSALDVSVQAQIINLLIKLRQEHQLAFLFISHDLSVVSHFCDRIAVMYLGKIVETGTARDIMENPRHPYTKALLAAIPRVGAPKQERLRLPGEIPSATNPPPGCPFHPRCRFAIDMCHTMLPSLEPCGNKQNHMAACHRRHESLA